ncbi:hypothetical protein PNEG_02190 [Pneumocystis murina B123]|uniref:DNA-directed RNA polymerase subunit n=1 Tax=Pneumocystis murina (strain B123) TaxID=1069680 RepID=M7NQR9_PNEMU|nr:hypothetical protein PNEG_02190 [Pneumocystis murina B123]EMR09607.1 hypothetical protein PNEG_02190 [Pneumocystis murina B123]
MNIAQPISTEVSSVDFGFYSPEEIEKISVKQIINPVIFDYLGHPSKGGLYDPALGPLNRSILCSTCHLDERYCPGHFGHIFLPTPMYHPLFLSQLYRLLKATCLYCHHFKLSCSIVNLYYCKLRLLNAGLVHESQEIDKIHSKVNKEVTDNKNNEYNISLSERREIYVQECLAKNEVLDGFTRNKLVDSEKRNLIKEFLEKITSLRKCNNCSSISPSFRKDGYVKIFELPLSKKHQEQMDALGKVRVNVLLETKEIKAQKFYDSSSDLGHYYKGNCDDAKIDVGRHNDFLNETMNCKILKASSHPRYMLPIEVLNHLRRLFTNEQKIISLLYRGSSRPDKHFITPDFFFIHVIAVPPTKFRPASLVGTDIHENSQNELFSRILQSCLRIKELNDLVSNLIDKNDFENKDHNFEMLIAAFVQLQHDVNSFVDSNRNPVNLPQGRFPPPGIKQILEKKEGLFRKHMMGKRVNYAARSVISPDPNIETNEIGIPPVFAMKLTYPEPVTSYNIDLLRHAVINGPEKWPGAIQVQLEDGYMISLLKKTFEERVAIANTLLTPQTYRGSNSSFLRVSSTNKKVFRHLRNNDILLLNRQPTLHKPSIMAHKARILSGEKTIRMHYSNCNAYNADFDGDEMNIHLPQNENARIEALLIANTDSQYLVPTSGIPLRGLIQDHIVTGVWITKKDTFFTKEQYQQLLYGPLSFDNVSSNSGKILTLSPTILKPAILWTGKQVISTILLNLKPKDCPGLNLISKAKVAGEYWGVHTQEQTVLFKDGYLLSGILDKSQFGASAFGLVHSVYELYGSSIAGKLLGALSRLFTKYIQMRGFTCSVDDLCLNSDGDSHRKKMIDNESLYDMEDVKKYIGLSGCNELDDTFKIKLEQIYRDKEKLQGLDLIMKKKMSVLTSSIINECIPKGLYIKFPWNNMQMMTISSAKGNNVNVSQISCLLGQQELEGSRVPIMVSGKSLPSFKPYDMSPRAGGYIFGRFLTGIRPQEYYFHCMAGREGLIDTAIKTSRSGYLQRCLIKHLEGIRVHYDHTVRDSDGSIVQFHYGEDSLDVTKQKYMLEFGFFAMNYKSLARKYHVKTLYKLIDHEKAVLYAEKSIKNPLKYDPVLSKYNPGRFLGSISEKFHKCMDDYIDKDPHNFFQKTKNNKLMKNNISKDRFRILMQVKYQQSLVHPGEAVGVLAGQSIGEPSTQMTLNTFHFAGLGAKNVTLGVPRLREIVLIANSNIKTPRMTFEVLDKVSDYEAELFAKNISKLILSDLVDKVIVTEYISIKDKIKKYNIKIIFFSKIEYEKEYNLSVFELRKVMQSRFLKELDKILKNILKKNSKITRKSIIGKDDATPYIGKAASFNDFESFQFQDESLFNNILNDNIESVKMTSQLKRRGTYNDDNDEEQIIQEKDAGYSDDNTDERSEIQDFENYMNGNENYHNNTIYELEMNEENNNNITIQNTEILENVCYACSNCRRFEFDNIDGKWCEIELVYPFDTPKLLLVSLIEMACKKTVVREISGISKCFRILPESKLDTSRILGTDGVNFKGIWEAYDIISVNTIYSNDIANVLCTYGVEAARNTIISEIHKLFKVYGIVVDVRHLTLISDYMTMDGSYKAFNRSSISSNVSPFLKMSFETTCNFLQEATLYGDSDFLKNPSAKLVMGKVLDVGTGSFDILMPLL